MSIKTLVNSKVHVQPKVYAYSVPDYPKLEGKVKIGYTTRDVATRIKEQTHTVGVDAKRLWDYYARFNSGETFDDHDFHRFLAKHKIPRDKDTEWFDFGVGKEMVSKELFQRFSFGDYEDIQSSDEELDYNLRKEQEDAVTKTLAYMQGHPEGEFLWNAKPRFGKTLAAYDLALRSGAKNILVITHRPAVADSWFNDFKKFIAHKSDLSFVSETPSLTSTEPFTRAEYLQHKESNPEAGQIAFVSLQDLKGSIYFGGEYDKLSWVMSERWDMLIIDESHEGVATSKSDIALDNIRREFTLHLSGTPFKAIASGRFGEEQIFNWSYADEQEAKASWDYNQEAENPYLKLPKLNMFTYQMSEIIREEVSQGTIIDGEGVDYAFDLNEFFATDDKGQFTYDKDVDKWLNTLTTNEKYPFSTEALRDELRHTFWILNRVASVKALARKLKVHPNFKDYEIISVAGTGSVDPDAVVDTDPALMRVKNAIAENPRTITLSVSQLTTGVTVPEWSAVFMLSNMASASLYMQAAFRAQNPHAWDETDPNTGQMVHYEKQNAYVFDFSPERTLIIFDEFANNLDTATTAGGGTQNSRSENIRRLLNFFPVIGEDESGTMHELDFNDVLTIPQALKSAEVVKRGFMSNLLFNNISNIFSAPREVLEMIGAFPQETQGKMNTSTTNIDVPDIEHDENGEIIIDGDEIDQETESLFGDKIVEIIVPDIDSPEDIDDDLVQAISNRAAADLERELQGCRTELGMSASNVKGARDNARKKIATDVRKLRTEFESKRHKIEESAKELASEATTTEEIDWINESYNREISDLLNEFKNRVKTSVSEGQAEIRKDIVKGQKLKGKAKEQAEFEESIRSRLRGFARTIPSFLMAYGDDELKLSNFHTYVPEDVFEDVTDTTLEMFIKLRDGYYYVDDEGNHQYYEGKLFNESVFDNSVAEFLKKKVELSDYFLIRGEDIFDYIPPQRTNQIYTPKKVVNMMVDKLEEENPGIFDNKDLTFADLYMKSGLYITAIVRRLFNSDMIKREIPNDDERLKHILENQVYGFAPTEIIFRIATNFIFGNVDDTISRDNFKSIDTLPYAKEGTLQELIDKEFE